MKGEYAKALEYFLQSLEIAEKLEDKILQSVVLEDIAAIYQLQGRLEQAQQAATKSMRLSKEVGFMQRIRQSASRLSDIYADMGRYRQAYENHLHFVEMKDSLVNETTS